MCQITLRPHYHWLIVVALGLIAGTAHAERMTLLATFDSERIGPHVPCDGQLRMSDGGSVVLWPWMHDGDDKIDGSNFRLATEHDAQSAKAARLNVVRRSTLPKGLILQVEAQPQAELLGTTKLGEFSVSLAELRRERAVRVLDGKARLQWIPNADRITGDQAEEEYASVAVLPNGQTAVAYVAWDGESDRVELRVGERTRRLTYDTQDYVEPRCIVDGKGQLWTVWASGDEGQWDLWASGNEPPGRLTTSQQNDFWPRLTCDSKGRIWLAWQTVGENLHYEVMLAQLGPDGLGTPTNVSDHPADDWEPAITSTPDGRVIVAWDSYRNGSFDVYLRQYTTDADGHLVPLEPPRPVAATARREAHATLASDSFNRVWLAWDVSMEDWGKHPQGDGRLHAWRSTEVACLAGGELKRPAARLMDSLPAPLGKFVEYPQIAVDGQDRVWLIFRIENVMKPFYRAGGRRAQTWGMWHVMASQFDGQAWSEPVLLHGSNGRQDIRVDVARDPDGSLLVVYGADARRRRVPHVPVDYDVWLASLDGFGVPMRPMEWDAASELGRVAPVAPDPELNPLPRRWNVGRNRYRLVVGDTHRHTDISRCGNGYDGSLQDAYRYALDTCGLDWLAISDHDQDILKHRNDRKPRPRQNYDWWRSQKYCDLYTIPGRFVALYGYEHGGSYGARGGHKNVIYAERGMPVHEVDAPHELFAALADSGALAIPHQLADGGSRTDWEEWDGEFERVGEIFQARGSYEFAGCPRAASSFTPGHSMWDALAKGVRIGIIASSDHGQTHQARAGVYVADDGGGPDIEEEINGGTGASGFTRRGILAGLRARRAYGATIACALQVRVDDHPLGTEMTVEKSPQLTARLVAPATIRRLDVVRDNAFVHTTEPDTNEAAFEFTDVDLQPGQSAYYYVRALIGEKDVAWSSPIWVTREK